MTTKAPDRSVNVRLTAEEKEQLLALAQAELRSLGQMGRLLILKSLQSAQSEAQRHSTVVEAR